MSHFDDIDFLFWMDSPASVAGTVIFLIILGGACFWACEADKSSAEECQKHGETYVDSHIGETLCKDDAGVVHAR